MPLEHPALAQEASPALRVSSTRPPSGRWCAIRWATRPSTTAWAPHMQRA